MNLLPSLERLGCAVRLCVIRNGHNPRSEVVEKAMKMDIAVDSIHCRSRLDIKALSRLTAELEAQSPNVLHTHGYKANAYGYVAAKRLRIPIVATCHNWTRASPAVVLYGALDRRLLRQFSCVVAVSPEVHAILRKANVREDKTAVIPNGIAGPLFYRDSMVDSSQEPGLGLRVAMVTRIVTSKGVGIFLEAACQVLREFPLTRFLVVGDGPERARFEHDAQQLGIADRVTFTGHIVDMDGIYSSIDVLTLPSFSEGLPMAILEAMAAGIAVIASNVGGIPRVITEGETGFLISPGDADMLARKIGTLIATPQLRLRLARNGREFVKQQFSAQKMAQSYLKLYRSLSPLQIDT